MIGKRDLLFLAVVGGGGLLLAGNLIPPAEPTPLTRYDATADRDASTVARIDAAFAESWAAEKLTPAAPAPDLAVARRVALGLMGTVPSLEEVRQFEALPTDQRLGWWVDHVLADRRSADSLGERLARAVVGTEDGPFVFYRRRRLVSWLADQVAANRPYDEVARELIAGTGVWTDHPNANFISVTVQNDKGNQPDPVRLAGRVTRAFLGLRLDCAQCHNHPFAGWKQADFEGLSAFFGQTHVGFKGVYDGGGEYEAEDTKTLEKRTVAPKVPFAPELLPADGSRRERLAAWVTHRENRFFALATTNRVWALLLGQPLFDPVDNLDPDGDVPEPLKLLAADFAASGYDLHRLIRVIVRTRAFRLDSRTDTDPGEGAEQKWAVFPLTRLRPDQVAGAVLQASTPETLGAESHILVKLFKATQTNDFVTRYGDTGEDEFDGRGGTIPQRLLLMNGTVVRERLKPGPFTGVSRVSALARDDRSAVEAAYLSALTRRPTPAEAAHFEAFLAADAEWTRGQRVSDLYWALVNSTEFSWNH